MSSNSEQDHSNPQNNQQNNYIFDYNSYDDDMISNIEDRDGFSQLDVIQKKQKQKQNGLMILPIFKNIIWMNDCQSEREKKIYPVLKLNFQVIYGKQFLSFQTKQQVLEYIDKNQVDQIQIKENSQLISINAPLYLILCNNSLLPYFQTNLSTKKQVYNKCLLFRDNTQNTNNAVYGSIKQAYDIIEIVEKLTKYLYEQNYKNHWTMYRQFNVHLKNQDQIDDDHSQDMKVAYKSGQMYEGELQPTSTIIQPQIAQIQAVQQQQYIRDLPVPEVQLIQQQEISSGELDETIQKYFVSNALNKIIGTDLECRFDPSAVSLIIMTSSPECRQYQSGEILIRNSTQIKQILQNEQKPKLIILTSQIQKQEEEISENQYTQIWIKCKFPIQTLTSEQKTIYKTKYENQNLSFSSKIKIIASIDQMEQVLRQAQDVLENSMF